MGLEKINIVYASGKVQIDAKIKKGVGYPKVNIDIMSYSDSKYQAVEQMLEIIEKIDSELSYLRAELQKL